MRPLHANLASRPFRDYSPVWATVAVLAILSAVLMVNNVQTAYDYFSNTKTTRAKIASLQEAVLQEQRRTDALEAQIRRIDFQDINEQIRYVNAQIAEKTFSWSRLLNDLERVVPKEVRLTTLNPSISESGEITLTFEAISRDAEGMVEMLNKLLADPHFSRPRPRNERTGNDGTQHFSMEVVYLPGAETIVNPGIVRTRGAR